MQKVIRTNESETDATELLLAAVKSKNPEARANAIQSVLADEITVDSALRMAMEEALNDEDANVRAQAVSTLAHLEDGGDPMPMLQKPLNDESVDVGLMTVDGINGNQELLGQALQDNDETVRSLAAAKLEALNR